MSTTSLGASMHVHAAPSGSAPPDPIAEARRSSVVASYTGGEVTVGEVEDAIGTATPDSLQDMSRFSMVEHWYYRVLKDELLLGEAQRRNYAQKPQVRGRLLELAVDQMLAEVIGEPIKSYVPSDEALQQFFSTRNAELGAPELRRVIELVVATEAEARALLPRFQATQQGGAMRELIKQNSLAASRTDDGYSRYFDKAGTLDDKSGSVDPALAQAAYALPAIGANSDVVALSGPEKRFAVIRLLALRPAYVPTLQQATPVMKKIMTDERRDSDRAALEQDARKRFPPKINYELLNSLPAELVPAE